MPAHRYFIEEDGKKVRVPSFSSIKGQSGWGSNGLLYWAWKVGYDGQTLEEARQPACDIGTVAHAMVEADVKGLPLPDLSSVAEPIRDGANKSFSSWLRWKQATTFELKAAEQSLVSTVHRYGGTFDMAIANGKTSLVELKTSNGTYPENVLQLAAYGMLWDEHYPDNPIVEYHLLRLSKTSSSFHHASWLADQMEAPRKAFLHLRALYDLEKEVKGLL